jgi:hypothetical protein
MKILVPLVRRCVRSHDCHYPEVTLWVRTRYDYTKLRFRIDTGADCCAIPVAIAQREGIAFTSDSSTLGTATGLVGRVGKYIGSIQLRLAGEDFDWPCDFVLPPANAPDISPVSTGRTSRQNYAILGRAGFLTAYTLCIDNKNLTLTRNHTHQPWWYRLGRLLWPEISQRRSHTDPL